MSPFALLALAWKFFQSPVGRWVGGVLAVLIALAGLRMHWIDKGRAEIRAEWEEANRKVAAQAAQRDIGEQTNVTTGSDAQLTAAQVTINQLSQERDHYADKLDQAEAARRKAEDELRDKKCPAPGRRGPPVLDQRGVDSLRVPAARDTGARR